MTTKYIINFTQQQRFYI